MGLRSYLIKGLLNVFFLKKDIRFTWTVQESEQYDQLFEQLCQSDQPYILPEHVDILRFLYFIQQKHQVLFHGTNQGQIETFEPRKQTLFNGKDTVAVFASQDPVWSMFYAVLDKQKITGSIRNACIRIANSFVKHYYFSINQATSNLSPWTDGYLYLLKREHFQPASRHEIAFDEWVSAKEVTPLGRIKLKPEDFPLLQKVTIHTEGENILKSWFLYKLRLRKK